MWLHRDRAFLRSKCGSQRFRLVHLLISASGGAYYHDRRFGLPNVAERMVHFTLEPFCMAGSQIGSRAAAIESLQQSVLNSKSPGFLRLFLAFTQRRKQKFLLNAIKLHVPVN
jgi:hypothetical protein